MRHRNGLRQTNRLKKLSATTQLGYSREETASLLGITTRTLDTWTGLEGGPPYVQFRRRKIFPKVQLEKWLEDNLQQ